MSEPVILLVSEAGKVLEALTADLRRRFGADYRILGADSPTAALTTVAGLAARSQEVALVIADQNMVQMPAAELMARAHVQLRTAKRVLLIDRGDWSAAHPAVAAMAVGKLTITSTTPGRRWNATCTGLSASSLPPGTPPKSRRRCRCGSSVRNGRSAHSRYAMS